MLLINSILFLMESHDIEIIIVHGELSPDELFKANNIENSKIKFVFAEPKGIYHAFNVGIRHSSGFWVMFFGGDDLVLPSLNTLLLKLNQDYLIYNAVVANVVFGDKGVFKPFKNKYGLIFKNWCQQGVLYNRNLFEKFSFDEKYKIQSDHKFNIEISSNKNSKILYLNDIISYFNTSGLSQSKHDYEFRKDMPTIIKNNYGFLYSWVAILRRSMGDLKFLFKNKTIS